MAGLTPTTTTPTTTFECCASEQRAICCEPSEKDGCCTPGSSSCGCSAGQGGISDDVREQVRGRYAAAARAASANAQTGRGCAVGVTDEQGREVFGGALYDQRSAGAAANAVSVSLGCGVPTAVADLREGETVLDLGSGAGADVLISAQRVGPTGKSIGLDMTDEMLDLARSNAEQAGLANVESDMDATTRADMQKWTGCIAGALSHQEFEQALSDAGLQDIEIRETHRVHEHAAAAIIRARKPNTT
jgi:arsenite methyltransferase